MKMLSVHVVLEVELMHMTVTGKWSKELSDKEHYLKITGYLGS